MRDLWIHTILKEPNVGRQKQEYREANQPSGQNRQKTVSLNFAKH